MFPTEKQLFSQEKRFYKARLKTKISQRRLSLGVQEKLSSTSGLVTTFSLGLGAGLLSDSSKASIKPFKGFGFFIKLLLQYLLK